MNAVFVGRRLNEGPPHSEKNVVKLQRGRMCADRRFSELGHFRNPVSLVGNEGDCQWGIGTPPYRISSPPRLQFTVISITDHPP
jgi:hypothetical protein